MGGVWCNSSVLHLMTLVNSLGSINAGLLVVKMTSPFSLVSGVGILFPYRHTINHLSFVSGFHLLPTFPLSVSRLSVCQATPASRILSQVGLCFMTPSFREPGSWTCTDLLRVYLPEQWLGTYLSQKMLAKPRSSRGSAFMVTCTTHPATRFPALSHCLCSYTGGNGSSMAPAGSFTHEEAVLPLPKALQAEDLHFPMPHKGSSDCEACSRGFTMLPYQSTVRH